MTSDIYHDDDGTPLTQSESIKRKLERDAARLFMRAYEQQFHSQIRHIWHNQPAKPDISCYLNGKALDLEIAHLYASEQEAQIASSDQAHNNEQSQYHGDEHLWAYLAALSSMDSASRLHTALCRILESKARKHYNSKRCWLVIRNASPLWQHKDFCQVVSHLTIPANPFEQIWLVPDFPGEEPLIKLYPGSV